MKKLKESLLIVSKMEAVNLLKYEHELNEKGIKLIAGVDEVGRGPLCGPVVAACVILPVGYDLPGLNDSKKLTEKKRDYFFDIISKDAVAIGVGIVDEKRIDEINIYQASKEAMIKAINNLTIKPEHVLIDAMPLELDVETTSIIHGDALSLTIAAASVIAKVTRDRMMYDLDKIYPEYGFAKHKGYPTKAHLEALQKFGILSNYRFTYKPISDLILNGVEIREVHK